MLMVLGLIKNPLSSPAQLALQAQTNTSSRCAPKFQLVCFISMNASAAEEDGAISDQ